MSTAVVVGSGPNGLSAGIVLAEAGLEVRIFESALEPGGGLRSFRNERFDTLHDQCSAVHLLTLISPFFRSIGIKNEVNFVYPTRAWAHALDNHSSLANANSLQALKHIIKNVTASFAGVAAHSMLPPYAPFALGTGALLGGVGYVNGWPIPIGGSQSIANFLLGKLEDFGVSIECNRYVDPTDLPIEITSADIVLWDTDPELAYHASSPRGLFIRGPKRKENQPPRTTKNTRP